MSKQIRNTSATPLRNHEFRNINGQMCTVGLPMPIELAALKAKHDIKPYSSPDRRALLSKIVAAGNNSLRTHA